MPLCSILSELLTRMISLVGVQAFKGSFKRTCVWIDPSGGNSDYILEGQQCGGHINATTGLRSSFIVSATGSPSASAPKGYTCPLGQLCMVCSEHPDAELS